MLGVVYKIEKKVYLSFYDIENNDVTDGISVIGDEFKYITESHIILVDVIIKDGTETMDIGDIKDFVDNVDKYEPGCIFYTINNILIGKLDSIVKEISDAGGFYDLAFELYDKHKEDKNEKENIKQN